MKNSRMTNGTATTTFIHPFLRGHATPSQYAPKGRNRKYEQNLRGVCAFNNRSLHVEITIQSIL